jgi:TonB-linked SusC/RagA family outer membrane protein
VFALASSAVWAQERTVTGRVTSAEDGAGLPGVNVVLKGTTNGTVTDAAGAYTLKVTGDGGILVFTFIGLVSQESEIGSRSTVDIAMESDTKQLSEVVVTALGVERQEKSLTYAVQNVDGDAMSKARETNVVNSLQGQVAGVQINNSSGNPSSSSRIVLRGASSITGTNQPLFVVDGVPIDNRNLGDATESGGTDLPNGAADINPDDVETITVLKGPVAAALYGNRGANGVILVTTKKGRGQKGLGVSVNHSTAFMTPLRLPSYQNSYGQGPSYTYFEYLDGQNGDGDGVDESWGPPLDKGLSFAQWPDYGKGTVSPWVSRPDNIRDIYRTGRAISNNIAISGGDGKNGFRMSFTDSRTNSIIPTQNLNKSTVNASGNITIAERLDASFTGSYFNTRSDNMGGGGYDDQNPVQQTLWSGRNVDFNALKNYNSLPLAPEGTASHGTPLNWNNQFQNNLFWVLDNNQYKYDKNRVVGSVQLAYKVADWLSISARSGIDSWSSRSADRAAVGTNSFLDGFYQEINRRFTEVNHFFLASANKKAGDFDFSLSLGGNIMDQKYTRQVGELPALQLPEVYNLSNLKSGFTAVNTNRYEGQKINSLLGSGQISFRDYVFLEFSGRNDWWSILPASDNSYFYPAASVSAILSDIFEMNSTALSYLKVRGGWSRVGSAGGLKPYSIQQTYSFRADPWGPTPLLYNPELLNNPNLTPETVTGIELGLAAKFFENKVSLDVTYYQQTSKDLIVEVEVSPSSGYEKALNNIGEIRNRGIEIQLGAQVVQTGDFTAGVKVNFAKNNNEVLKVNNIDGDEGAIVLGGQWNTDLQAREGNPFGVLFGPAFKRDPDGNVIHQNGLPVIDSKYKVLGNIQPDWTGGVSLDLGYKGFSFNTLVDARMGSELYSMTTTWGRTAGVLEETLIGREGGIIGTGSMQTGTAENGDPIYSPNNVVVSSETYNHIAYSQNVAENSVFDASYVKLRQIMFSYRVPNTIMGKLPFRDVTIGFVARNVALLYSKIPHVDPESAFSSEDNDQGLEFGQIPSTRSLGFNINFKL